MYVLISKAKLRSMGDSRFHETLPDGRMIVTFSDLRSFGCLSNVDIVMTKRELDAIIAEQKASGLYPEEITPEVVPDGQSQPMIPIEPLPDAGSQNLNPDNPEGSVTEIPTPPKEPVLGTTDPVVDTKPTEQSNTVTNENGGKA